MPDKQLVRTELSLRIYQQHSKIYSKKGNEEIKCFIFNFENCHLLKKIGANSGTDSPEKATFP